MLQGGYHYCDQDKYEVLKLDGGCQRPREGENGELVFSRYTVSVTQNEKSSQDGQWWWLHNNGNVFNTPKLYT